MKILRKIIEAIIPVSRKEFDLYMANMTNVLEGMTVATDQQAQVLTTITQQLMALHRDKEQKQKKQEKEVLEYDEAFQ